LAVTFLFLVLPLLVVTATVDFDLHLGFLVLKGLLKERKTSMSLLQFVNTRTGEGKLESFFFISSVFARKPLGFQQQRILN